MATTFDTPVLLTEVAHGRFRIYRGGGVPAGVPHKEPSGFPGLYRITGPLEVYHRISPPDSDVSREEVFTWLEGARRLGCDVEASRLDTRGSRG